MPPSARASRAPPSAAPPERPQVPDRAPIFPKEIFWGGSRAPAEEAGAGVGAGAAASEAVPPWPPEFPDPPWVPERAPPWRHPVLSCLRVP